MQLEVLVRWRLWLTVCLGLGLAGCTTGVSRRWAPQTCFSATTNGSETAGQVITGRARPGCRAELEADEQPDEAVELAQFESASTMSEPAPDPPDVLPRSDKDSSVPDGSVVDPAPSLSAEGPLRPRRIDEVMPLSPDEPEQVENICELDLTEALSLVAGQNPQIAFASQRYREAYAQLEAARVLWLPSIRAGISYNKHEGTLQSSSGAVFDRSRGSLHSGLGARYVGTGSPGIPGLIAHFHLTDAVFQPRIANRVAAARSEAARAATHDVLLDTALAYLELLRAIQAEAIAEETLEHAQQLADLTATFAQTGQGPQADADRARAELVVHKNDVSRAEEEIEVKTARLNEWLHLDPTTIILPREPAIAPLELVAREKPLTELLATGLSNRPELAESRHLVGEAVHRYRREKYAPLLPSAFLGVSYSGFGGGTGSTVENFRDRFDFDVAVYWELRNLGFGECAAREEARARYQQAQFRNIQIMDRVAREIIEAHAQIQARHKQIALAESGIQAATDSYERNMQRIRAGEGLPIEVLQSIRALDQARREYLRAVVDYNEAQFRLHRALGWPIQ